MFKYVKIQSFQKEKENGKRTLIVTHTNPYCNYKNNIGSSTLWKSHTFASTIFAPTHITHKHIQYTIHTACKYIKTQLQKIKVFNNYLILNGLKIGYIIKPDLVRHETFIHIYMIKFLYSCWVGKDPFRSWTFSSLFF